MRRVFGVIAPHPPIMVSGVGGDRARVTADSLEALGSIRDALRTFAPETLVVMSPHAPSMADAFVVDDAPAFRGNLGQFGDSRRYSWPGDPALAHALLEELASAGIAAVSRATSPSSQPGELDHGSLVPLSFVAPTESVQIVVLSLSYMSYAEHRALGVAVDAAAQGLGRRIAFVASGDLSHRLTPEAPAGYSPRARLLDDEIVSRVREGELSRLMEIDSKLIEAGGECGLRSFIALGGYCGIDPIPTTVLSYEGPWGVGYLTAVAGADAVQSLAQVREMASRGYKGGMPGGDESTIVALARDAIERFVRHAETITQPVLQGDAYPARAGVFVSLHRRGDLRGCIGTILPTRAALAHEVVANAIEAATRDPRFPPLEPQELEDLEVKVDVLHAPESCTLQELDPQRYGVITSSGWRRGLLLPALDGVDDVETQVRIAMSKAGIQPGEPCAFERFLVDRYT